MDERALSFRRRIRFDEECHDDGSETSADSQSSSSISVSVGEMSVQSHLYVGCSRTATSMDEESDCSNEKVMERVLQSDEEMTSSSIPPRFSVEVRRSGSGALLQSLVLHLKWCFRSISGSGTFFTFSTRSIPTTVLTFFTRSIPTTCTFTLLMFRSRFQIVLALLFACAFPVAVVVVVVLAVVLPVRYMLMMPCNVLDHCSTTTTAGVIRNFSSDDGSISRYVAIVPDLDSRMATAGSTAMATATATCSTAASVHLHGADPAPLHDHYVYYDSRAKGKGNGKRKEHGDDDDDDASHHRGKVEANWLEQPIDHSDDGDGDGDGVASLMDWIDHALGWNG